MGNIHYNRIYRFVEHFALFLMGDLSSKVYEFWFLHLLGFRILDL